MRWYKYENKKESKKKQKKRINTIAKQGEKQIRTLVDLTSSRVNENKI